MLQVLVVTARNLGNMDKMSDSMQIGMVQKTDKHLILPYHWWKPLLLMLGKVKEAEFFVKGNTLVMSVINTRNFLIANRNC